MNFTPVPHQRFRLGVPEHGNYHLALNSDAGFYSGSDMPVQSDYQSESVPWMNQPVSIVLDIPPLAGLILLPRRTIVMMHLMGLFSSTSQIRSTLLPYCSSWLIKSCRLIQT